MLRFPIGFRFCFSPVFGLAKITDSPAFSDFGCSALWAEANFVGHESGDDAVGVATFVPLALEFGLESGVFVFRSVWQDGLLEVLAAPYGLEAQEAF